MNFSWWRIIMFALVGAAGLAFLAWYNPPGAIRAVNRHTGRMVDAGMPNFRRLHTASAAMRAARSLGDTKKALRRLEKARHEVANPALLEPVLDLLAAELSALGEPLLSAEGRLDFDARIANDTEQYFAPIILRRPTEEEIRHAIVEGLAGDRLAAWVISGAGGQPYSVPLDQMLDTAKSFRSIGRPRARLRWLVRAFRKAPPSDALSLRVCKAFLEYGRLAEAFAALTPAVTRGTSNVEIWRRRVEIARWLSKTEEEAKALEGLIGFEDAAGHRKRLAEIYTFLGRPEDAIPHATELAVMMGGPEGLAEAAAIAFEAGEVDKAFTLLERAVEIAEDPQPWRELLVEYMEKDLRFDDAILELRYMAENNPDSDYARRLEALLRRRDRPAELVDLLRKRYEANPDPKLEAEIIRLSATLGRLNEVRDILAARVANATDPGLFFRNLLLYHAAGIDGLPDRAAELARSPKFTRADVPRAIDALRELKDEPGFEAVAVGITIRFRDMPEARAIRIETLDWNRTPMEAAAAAEGLYREQPGEHEFLKAWIDRAAWAGLADSEIRARQIWLKAAPDQVDNRRRIAELLDSEERWQESAAHWLALVAVDGEDSPSEDSYLASLRAAGNIQGELDYLMAKTDRPDLTKEQRLRLAERFFSGGWMDVALKLYLLVLGAEADQRLALLRVGQIRAWGNDPSGAIPCFERLIELDGLGDGEVPYLLGEAYYANRREEEGMLKYREALPLLREEENLTPPRESMVAKILAREGEGEESRAIYERLVALDPENQDLLLDFADSMIVSEQPLVARSAVDEAKALGPDDRRLLRIEGQLLIVEDKPEEAATVLKRGLDRYGADAGFYSDLGYAKSLAGEWVEAKEAYEQVLVLQPESENAAWSLRVLGDRLRPAAELEFLTHTVGDDEVMLFLAEGSMTALDDRSRIAAAISQGSYSGRADAVDEGKEDITADITTVSLSAFRRFGREWELGGGLDFYSGRDEAPPAGFWAGGGWRSQEPYASVTVRFFGNEPFVNPVAAAGLSGQSDGVELTGMIQDLDARFWASAALTWRALTIEHPRRDTLTDAQATVELTGGWWIDGRGPRIEQRLTARRGPISLEGTTVAFEPTEEEGVRVGTWLTYTGIRLLDDKALAGPLPLGEEFDYVTASVRAQGRVSRGLYFEVEGYAGTDLSDFGVFGGAAVGLAWRPQPGIEIRVRGGHGEEIGREDADTGSNEVRLALTMLW